MNRREFVKAGAGAFAIASAGTVFGDNAPSSRVRLAIVGCREQGRGYQVMKQAMKVPGVEVACVCDVDSRARDAAAAYVIKETGKAPKKEKDFRKVLEDAGVDAVVSETPDHFHAYSAVMAMRAGKHVYVEKPCAFCPQECETIVSTWKRTGKVFQMGSQRRSAPSFMRAVREIRAEGLIGAPKWGKTWYMTLRKPIGNGKPVAVPEWLDWDLWQATAPREQFRDNVVHYNWHWFRAWGTGECGNNAVHFVDAARWLMGADEFPVEVSSAGGKFWIPESDDWKWHDTQNASFRWRDGKFMTWEGLSCTNVKPFMNVSTGAMVYGDAGAAFFGPGGDAEVFDLKGKSVRKWASTAVAEGGAMQTNTDNRSGGGWRDSTRDHLANFVDCIRADAPEKARSNAEIGTKSTYLALAANVAQDVGATLKIDPATGRPVGNAAASRLWTREYAKGWEVA